MDATNIPASSAAPRGRDTRSVARIAFFDVIGPLVAYALLRRAGQSAVSALIISGALPGSGVVASAVRRRHLEVIGALVLAGIAVGAVLGLATHSARLVLLEGSVPTAVFGVACLLSLRAPRPLLFGFAHEFAGPDTDRGRQMERLWGNAGYRHAYRVVTAVWGAGYLIEAAIRVIIIEHTAPATALVASKFLPYVCLAVLAAWTIEYRRHQWKRA